MGEHIASLEKREIMFMKKLGELYSGEWELITPFVSVVLWSDDTRAAVENILNELGAQMA